MGHARARPRSPSRSGSSFTKRLITPSISDTGLISSGANPRSTVIGDLDPPADPVCGDGVLNTNEQCDDGNTLPADGCSSTCQTEQGGIEVRIDVKPGSTVNPINLKGEGEIPVAILGSPGFRVSDLDRMTLRFGYCGNESAGTRAFQIEDVRGSLRIT